MAVDLPGIVYSMSIDTTESDSKFDGSQTSPAICRLEASAWHLGANRIRKSVIEWQ
ncbi:MAG: hypothetical protein ABW098_19960 [Candidatus Thiodiazotropha sp.]